MKTRTRLEIAITTLISLMIIGTLAYHYLEGWGYVDSFYFTGITMTTIGYGDLHPSTAISKIFTVFFAFSGVGISLITLSLIATSYIESREKKMSESLHKRVFKLVENIKNQKNSKK